MKISNPSISSTSSPFLACWAAIRSLTSLISFILTNRLLGSFGTTLALLLGRSFRTWCCRDLICLSLSAIFAFFRSKALDSFLKIRCCSRGFRPDPFRNKAACFLTWKPAAGVAKMSRTFGSSGDVFCGQTRASSFGFIRRGFVSGTDTSRGHKLALYYPERIIRAVSASSRALW